MISPYQPCLRVESCFNRVIRKNYVDAILKKLPKDNLHLNTEIISVSSTDHGVELVEANGAIHDYDHVILASVYLPTPTQMCFFQLPSSDAWMFSQDTFRYDLVNIKKRWRCVGCGRKGTGSVDVE